MDTILLATDGLKSSAQALDFAIELASEHGSNLVIAHVVRTPIDMGDDLDDGELTRTQRSQRTEHGRATLEHAAAEAAAHAVTATTSLLPGPLVDAILDCRRPFRRHPDRPRLTGPRGVRQRPVPKRVPR